MLPQHDSVWNRDKDVPKTIKRLSSLPGTAILIFNSNRGLSENKHVTHRITNNEWYWNKKQNQATETFYSIHFLEFRSYCMEKNELYDLQLEEQMMETLKMANSKNL